MTVGSSPKTSSPTLAWAMACRMAGEGVVTVSLRRSIMGAAKRKGPGKRPLMVLPAPLFRGNAAVGYYNSWRGSTRVACRRSRRQSPIRAGHRHPRLSASDSGCEANVRPSLTRVIIFQLFKIRPPGAGINLSAPGGLRPPALYALPTQQTFSQWFHSRGRGGIPVIFRMCPGPPAPPGPGRRWRECRWT
ncbi:hypothetical protein ES703_97537 [subsurface metagenome]